MVQRNLCHATQYRIHTIFFSLLQDSEPQQCGFLSFYSEQLNQVTKQSHFFHFLSTTLKPTFIIIRQFNARQH